MKFYYSIAMIENKKPNKFNSFYYTRIAHNDLKLISKVNGKEL